jgi:hypothetical protein
LPVFDENSKERFSKEQPRPIQNVFDKEANVDGTIFTLPNVGTCKKLKLPKNIVFVFERISAQNFATRSERNERV